MLLWHLFFAPNPVSAVFSPILRFISIVGDFCVSAFLFVSGYGLTKQYQTSSTSNGMFVAKRLIKFYFNFWFIFIIFVPLGILIFKVPLETNYRGWIKQILSLAGQDSYNSAWWFNGLIVRYYIIFPLLFFLIKRKPLATFVTTLFFTLILFFTTRINHLYVIIFIVGILWAYYNNNINSLIHNFGKRQIVITCSLIFITALFCLYFIGETAIYLKGLPFFGIITVLTAIIIKCFKSQHFIYFFCYLGFHSGNIYMIHSFLYYYWFPDFFYSLSPILSFSILLTTSLTISILLEKGKSITKWNYLSNIIYRFWS